jgi:Ulp1 protease family, C-terminal catalytic domain
MDNISFDSGIQHSDERLSVGKESDKFVARHPTGLESFGRKLLNVLSTPLRLFGYSYTRDTWNPRQWANFKTAMQREFQGQISKRVLDEVFRTYSHTERLTMNKAAVITDDLERLAAGKESVTRRNPERLNASQSMPARALRTLWKVVGGANEHEQRALARLNPRQNSSALNRSVRSILRPGRSMGVEAVINGQRAIQLKHANNNGIAFHSVDAPPFMPRLDEYLGVRGDQGALQRHDKEIQQLHQAAREGKRAILSIPFTLEDSGLPPRENHFVEIAVDFNQRKVLYLDPKGTPLDEARQHYGNQGPIFGALESFGRKIFGNDWDSRTGILQVQCPKQQGANDCGAFTHEFTRRLVEGQSVGDIERSFTSDDRDKIRSNMANDILDFHDPGLEEVFDDSYVPQSRVVHIDSDDEGEVDHSRGGGDGIEGGFVDVQSSDEDK